MEEEQIKTIADRKSDPPVPEQDGAGPWLFVPADTRYAEDLVYRFAPGGGRLG